MKYILGTILLIGVSVLIFFATQQNTNTSPSVKKDSVEPTFTIVAFGDSLTAGYGIPVQESYPAQLEKKLQ